MLRFRVGLVLLVVLLGGVFVPGVVRDAAGQSYGAGFNVYAGLPTHAGFSTSGSGVITRYRGAPRGSRVEGRVSLFRQVSTGSKTYRLVRTAKFTLAPGRRRATRTIFFACSSRARANYGWVVGVYGRVMVGRRTVARLEHESSAVLLPCR